MTSRESKVDAYDILSSNDVAATAYANGVQFFEQELSQDKRKREWIRARTSMKDVCEVVDQAKKFYDSGSDCKKKASKWVNRFANTVIYYGGVLDVLVQSDPTHAGLVWGALKFVFSVSPLSRFIYKL